MFVPQQAKAVDGVTAVGYYINNNIPPQRDDSVYAQCGSTVYPNINWTWDYEQTHLGDCGWDQFAVHFTGNITIPDGVQTVQFWIAHDDGAWATIGGNQFGSWNDQGCMWTVGDPIIVEQQVMPLDLWVYENGGGTCAMLAWDLDNTGLAIVPAEAFTTSPSNTTTTSESTTTTTTTTTTSTTTTSTSTLPASTTTTMQTTTTQESTTTSQVPQTLSLPVEPASTTTEQPTTTLATPDTEVPVETVPELIAIDTLPPDEPITDVDVPVTTVVPVLPPEPVVDEPVVIDETVLDEAANNIVALVALVANLDEATPEQIEAVVDAVLEQEVSQEQATVLAGSAEVLAVITQDQASQIFEALDLNELSDNQLVEVIAAVQDAPTEVREAFETEINIFDGAADTYVPIGSAVPISSRRVVIAATGIVVAAAAGSAVQSHSARKNG